jgi:small subunit ribosomal protein S17
MATKTTPADTTADQPTADQPTADQPTADQPVERRHRRQQKLGKVVSDKMQKTIVVAVESLKRDRIYKRTYKYTNKFKAHDEHNSARIGDVVRIEETRPLSKEKRWRLVEIVQRAVQVIPVEKAVQQLDPHLGAEAEADEER